MGLINCFVALVSSKLANRIRLQGTMVTRQDRCCSIHNRILNQIILDYNIYTRLLHINSCLLVQCPEGNLLGRTLLGRTSHMMSVLHLSQSCTSVVYLYRVPQNTPLKPRPPSLVSWFAKVQYYCSRQYRKGPKIN